MITLSPFDPLAPDDALWTRFHGVRRVLAAEDAPDRAIPEDHAAEQRLKFHPDPHWTSRWWLAFEDGEAAGRMQVATRGGEDPQRYAGRVFVSGGVLPQHRRRRIGTVMARHLHELMRRENHDAAIFPLSRLEPGAPFLEFLGARLAYEDIDHRLLLADVDWAAVDGRVHAAPAVLRWEEHDGRAPVERLRELAPQVDRLLADVPRGDLDLPAPRFEVASYEALYRRMDTAGGAHLLVMLFDGARLVALCETSVDPASLDIATQLFTGVDPSWRGRGLAAAVKARTLQLLRGREPAVRIVETRNAASNHAMLRVNQRLGFRVQRRCGAYEVSCEQLGQSLRRS